MASSDILRRSKTPLQAFWTKLVSSNRLQWQIGCDSPGSPWRPERPGWLSIRRLSWRSVPASTKSSNANTFAKFNIGTTTGHVGCDSHHYVSQHSWWFALLYSGSWHSILRVSACFNQFLRKKIPRWFSTATVPTNTGWPFGNALTSSTTALNFASRLA